MPTEILSPSYKAFKAAHTAATTAKVPLLINSVPVIPLNTALANANNVFVYSAAQARVPKATGQAWAPLTKIYLDDTNKVFTTDAAAGVNKLAGVVAEDAASGDAEGIINLDPMTTNA